MPRRKRTAPSPILLDSFWHGIQYIEVVHIDEYTEAIGKGSAQKVKRLKNFNKALEAIAEDYFWGNTKARKNIRRLVDNPRKITELGIQMALKGVELEDRAMRNLAKEVKKHIKILEKARLANLNNSGTS